MAQRGRRRIPQIAAVIAAVSLLFFWNYFLQDETLFAGDTAYVFLPLRAYVRDRLASGFLPLWNPHLFGGTPALAEAQYQLFYLPNLLHFLTGVPRGMGWLLSLHFGWMAAGTYLFARRSLSLERSPALFAALAFTFGGFIQSKAANSPYIEAAAWMPWLLYAYDVARRRRGAALVLPGLVLAAQVVTGAPQFCYYSLVLLFCYHLFRLGDSDPREARRRAWGVLLVTVGLGAAVAAAQLVPQAELALQSARGTRAPYGYVTEFSLAPKHLLATLLLPGYFGTFNGPPRDGFFPAEEQAYLGAITLVFLVVGIVCAGSRREVWFWALVALAAVLLALGANNPVYPALYRILPGFATFRAPARWLLLFSFAGALLSGFGLQTLLQAGPHRGRSVRIALGIAVAVLAIGGGVLLVTGASSESGSLAPLGNWGPLVFLAIGAAALLRRHPMDGEHATGLFGRLSLPVLVIGVLVLDLFTLSQDMEIQHTVPVAVMERRPATLEMVANGNRERLWSLSAVPLEKWQAPPNTLPGATAYQYRVAVCSMFRELMPSCVPAQYGAWGLTGVWGALMPLRRHARPLYEVTTPIPNRQYWLRLLGVRYYPISTPAPELGLEPVIVGFPALYQDPNHLPPAFFAPGSRVVTGEETVRLITAGELDPRQEVLLEPGVGGAAQDTPGSGPFTPARLATYQPEHVRIEAEAPSAGFLVLMDTPYPGWRTTLDGQPARARPANWVGRAVPVAAGSHQLEMRFEPQSVRVGLFITLAALCGVVAVSASAGRRAGRQSESGSGSSV